MQAHNNSLCHEKSNHPCHCKLLKTGSLMNLMATGLAQPKNPYKHTKLYSVYKQMSQIFKVDPSSLPRASQIMDTTMVQACHNEYLPSYGGKCMAVSEFRKLVNFVNDHGKTKVNSRLWKVISYLKMVPLLHEIANKMIEKTKEKFFLYSGHDSTIDPLLTLLGINKGTWPPYASRIVFEQYEYNKNSYFRILFNGRNLVKELEFCKGAFDDDNELCKVQSLQRFVNFLYLKELKSKSYTEACSSFSILDNSLYRS